MYNVKLKITFQHFINCHNNLKLRWAFRKLPIFFENKYVYVFYVNTYPYIYLPPDIISNFFETSSISYKYYACTSTSVLLSIFEIICHEIVCLIQGERTCIFIHMTQKRIQFCLSATQRVAYPSCAGYAILMKYIVYTYVYVYVWNAKNTSTCT